MKKSVAFLFTAVAILGSCVGVFLNTSKAQAQCGWGDITCSPDRWTCPIGGCSRPPGPSDSSVGRDMTPPRVRISRDLIRKGYSCIEVSEFPRVTCSVPSGMNRNQFSTRFVSFHSSYLGNNKGWGWDCLNRNGQLWGMSNGQLLCQMDMR